MMMSCDIKFLLKCQQCLFLRLLYCQYLLDLMCITGGFVLSRDFSYHIPNLFNKCFMIDFRNIRSP